jgi:malonate transporter and related proteins
MEAVFNVALPVFAVILAGYGAGYFGIMGPASSETLNRFVFYGALPPLLFVSLATVEPDAIFNWPFIGAYLGGILAVSLISLILSKFVFGLDLPSASIQGMTAIFGNTGYMGIPLATVAFGPEAVLPAAIATVINSALIIGIVTALVEIGQNKAQGMTIARDVLRALVRNPLLMASLAGIVVSVFDVPLAKPIETFARILGGAAGPGALFAIGLFLVGRSFRGHTAEVAAMVWLKLMVQPLVTWGLVAIFFPMDPLWAGMVILLAALPSGANVFVLAQRYNTYVDQSSAAIMFSTCLSVVSVAFFLAFIG